MNQAVCRSRLQSGRNPDQILAGLLGSAFADYRRRWAEAEQGRRPEAPLHLDIDVTSACNFHCPMCPAGNSGHIFPGFKKGLFLDRNLYRRVLKEAASFGLPSLRLGVTGEPLLVPHIDEWVREAAQAGVLDISLITNARLLSPQMSRRLIEAGLTRLMISVDAAGPETYSRVRPGGDWDVLLANIDAFLKIRAESQRPIPLLRVSFVEMSVNRADRESFTEIFQNRADYLSFQSYLNILGAKDTDFHPADGQTIGRAKGFCSEPYTRLALHADGGLFPCCSDFGRIKTLGRLPDNDLLSVWLSPAAESLRRAGAWEREPCRSCSAGSN